MNDNLAGFLLLNKPTGVTSFDCVALVRRKLNVRRVGHCGTLDPLARGLLILVIGQATRSQESFLALDKEYWFRAEFGFKTATGDLEGDVTEIRPAANVTLEKLQDSAKSFIGEIDQQPPMYSALKYQGKPYYYYARKAIEIPRLSRRVQIHDFDIRALRGNYWDARVICSRGMYVRVLIEDVAAKLGTCATLLELTRERIGHFHSQHALKWEELRQLSGSHLGRLVTPVEGVSIHA